MSVKFNDQEIHRIVHKHLALEGTTCKEIPIIMIDDTEIFRSQIWVNVWIDANSDKTAQYNKDTGYPNGFPYSDQTILITYLDHVNNPHEYCCTAESTAFSVPYGSHSFEAVVFEGPDIREDLEVTVETYTDEEELDGTFCECLPKIAMTIVLHPLDPPVDLVAEVSYDDDYENDNTIGFYGDSGPDISVTFSSDTARIGEKIDVRITIDNLYFGIEHYTIVGVPYTREYTVDIYTPIDIVSYESEEELTEYSSGERRVIEGEWEVSDDGVFYVTVTGMIKDDFYS